MVLWRQKSACLEAPTRRRSTLPTSPLRARSRQAASSPDRSTPRSPRRACRQRPCLGRGARFASVIDDRQIHAGDRFYVRYTQDFTLKGAPIGVGHVLWAELRTAAKGTVAIHRFRTRDKVERFWLANGQAATPPADAPAARNHHHLLGFRAARRSVRPAATRCRQGLGDGRSQACDDAPDTAAADAAAWPAHRRRQPEWQPEQRSGGVQRAAVLPTGPCRRSSAPAPALFLHAGVDLVASVGTPIHAAADGVVVGAAPNGGYGNWIRIDHADHLSTVYGHLSAFAPGIVPGEAVARGEVIGFVGSTGRSTGAHRAFRASEQ